MPVAKMTESQRRWEAWFDAYARIDDAWPDRLQVPCPEGDGGVVRIAYLAGPRESTGMAILWCEVGRTGIFLHRVRIPDAAPRFPVDSDDDELDKVIPPDVHLWPPDPVAEELPD